MKYRAQSFTVILTILFFAIFSSSCEKLDLKKYAPNCIKRKIRKIKREEVQNPPAKVYEWKVDGKTYYYITSDCCDQYNYLYDNNCKQVCAPDGGFSGGGDGNCPNYKGQIKLTMIWEDER